MTQWNAECNSYQQQQPEFSQPDSSLVVPVFQKGDDPIDAINHMMSFLTVVVQQIPVSYYQQSAKDLSETSSTSTIYDWKGKARDSKPKLYDGNTIPKGILYEIPESDETLKLCEDSPQLYDFDKPKRVFTTKEQCDALIQQVNIKSGEISELNAKLQEQYLVIAALKNELRKLKGKAVDKEAIESHSVDPNVSKENMEPITPRLMNKGLLHEFPSYNKHTRKKLCPRAIVEHVKANYPQDSL
ncbi:hypothetical protein Tco_0517322 [Tanacetum coccineum]